MLQNAYFLAKIGADTAENEQRFAEILPIGRSVAGELDGCAAWPSPGRLPPARRRQGPPPPAPSDCAADEA